MFSLLPLATLALAAISAVTAAPIPAKARPGRPGRPGRPRPSGRPSRPGTGFPSPINNIDCAGQLGDASPNFPEGQTNLTIPAGQTANAIALGRGTQNYTCSAGTWASAGAVATLLDVSCLFNTMPTDAFFALPSMALNFPNPGTFSAAQGGDVARTIGQPSLATVGTHYFVPNGASSAPKFDWTTTDPADSTQYVTLSKLAVLDDPVDKAANVQWLQLQSIAGQGSFSKTVFRVDTAGGPAQGTCSDGETQEIDYASFYFFYN